MGGRHIAPEQFSIAKPRSRSTGAGNTRSTRETGTKPSRPAASTAATRRRGAGRIASATIDDAEGSLPGPATETADDTRPLEGSARGRGAAPLVLWLGLVTIGMFVLALIYQLEGP